MKSMKRAIAIAALLGMIVANTVRADIVRMESLTCENGFKDAYIATQIDASFGCIVVQYGIDCDGKPFEWHPEIVIKNGDPGGSYQWYYSGAGGNGGAWYLKVAVDGSGFVRGWGRRADGAYYEVASMQ
jgi:hypothetical protein